MSVATLKVTSHVGRDLLQSAQLFRHEHAVAWEYVSNGLQYKDPTVWPAPGSEDTELGVLMEPEVRHGEAEVHA